MERVKLECEEDAKKEMKNEVRTRRWVRILKLGREGGYEDRSWDAKVGTKIEVGTRK